MQPGGVEVAPLDMMRCPSTTPRRAGGLGTISGAATAVPRFDLLSTSLGAKSTHSQGLRQCESGLAGVLNNATPMSERRNCESQYAFGMNWE
jgi:hypothetical protein